MKMQTFKKLILQETNKYADNNRKLQEYIDHKIDCLDYYCSRRYPTNPKEFKRKATRIGETQYQREIYKTKHSILASKCHTHNISVDWADIELPVVFGPARRRPSVDLVGITNNKPFLCEVKYKNLTKKNPDTPLYGIFELIIYYYIVKFANAIELDNENVHHPDAHIIGFMWQHVDKLLILAANNRYWMNETILPPNLKPDLKTLISDLNRELAVDIRLFNVGDDDPPCDIPSAPWNEICL